MPEEKDEKLKYLKRDEVKTMQKDIAKLREVEAGQEREKVSQIKTEEELLKERARKELAQKAAQERILAEEQAKEQEEQIKKQRIERESSAQARAAEEEKTKQMGTEGFKDVLKKTQAKEEAERKKFLQRIEAKAEGKEELPLAPPPPLPPLPVAPEKPSPLAGLKEISKKIPRPVLKKPSFVQKLWIRIVLTLLTLAVLAAVATFWYWYLVVREKELPVLPISEQKQEEQKQPIVPPALMAVDRVLTLEMDGLAQTLAGDLEESQVIRLLLKNPETNQILGLKAFFQELGLTAPAGFYDLARDDFTLFIYSQLEGNRLGLITKSTDKSGLTQLLTSWEPNMENDLANLFSLMGKKEPALSPNFKNGNYEDLSFRFQTFSRQDLGIVYSIFLNDYFILTSSWKGMETTLQKLREEPLSLLPFSPVYGAEFVLDRLTLREKIGQMFLVGISGKTLTPATQQLIDNVQPGGILLLKRNIGSEGQIKKLNEDLQKTSLVRSGLPLLISVDQEGQPINRIDFVEEKTAQQAINNPDQALEVGLARGQELKKLGINLNLAPVLDLTEPDDFLFSRSFQKDVAAVSELAKSLILGHKQANVLVAVKHFPGYGKIAFNPEKTLAVLNETPETWQFQKVMESEPELVMTSNVIYVDIDPDLPFTFSPQGIALLKEELGNDCLIITDDLPQDYLLNKFSLKELVTLPVKAGADILIFSNPQSTIEQAADLLYQAVKNNEISEDRINQSVLKIIKLKESLLQ